MDLIPSYSRSAPHITQSEQVGLGVCSWCRQESHSWQLPVWRRDK